MDGLKISVPSVGHLKNLLLTLLLPIFLGNFNNLEGGIVERKAFNLSPSKVASGSFTSIPAEESGLEFINHYQDPRMWSSRYLPATAGATGTGLAVGDFDDDGWADIFAVSREGQNRLYKNLSGLRFEDVTDKAGIDPSLDWNSGVTSVDIDTDGDLDLYVCAYNSPNQFYINHGNGTFEDQAFQLGLDIWDASNAAYFADYDRDGDLDLYLQTNQLEEENNGDGRVDYLFRNDGADGFKDVTDSSGISGSTLGHSVLWIDYDEDGWEDIYVANDFEAPDFLYRNRGDGTFSNQAHTLPQIPYSSMGSDLGDVNNDGHLDMLIADMATNSYEKHTVSMLPTSRKTLALPAAQRPPQIMKNALLLNRKNGEFIDAAYAWKIAATEWTWAVRLQDFDNDGWQDAFFTNGMMRQFHNADLTYQQDQLQSKDAKRAVFPRSPILNEENLIYRNESGTGFANANKDWGIEHVGVSFGAVTCDFDQDGDLDILYTNYNNTLSLWRNDLETQNAIQVKLERDNGPVIGTTIIATYGTYTQAQKLLSNRGYQSSEEAVIHFGLGTAITIDRLTILWPDEHIQIETNLSEGYRYTINYEPKTDEPHKPSRRSRFDLISTVPSQTKIEYAGKDDKPLYPFKPLPKTHSSRNVQADINNDGLKDRIVGGIGRNNEIVFRGGSSPKLIIQSGTFRGRGNPIFLSSYDWDGTIRILPGMIDLADYAPSIPSMLGSFKNTGSLDANQFVQRTGFTSVDEQIIDQFETQLLLQNMDGSFAEGQLPQEIQYGRVWDIEVADINADGLPDLVAILGYVSPHPSSSQAESSFISVFLGNTSGNLIPDTLPPFSSPIYDALDLSLEANRLRVTRNSRDDLLFSILEDH